MADVFESSRRVLARAKEHIADLDTKICAFIKKNPYKGLIEVDPERPDHELHKIKLTEPIPACFDTIASDAVSNLRATLDQAGYAVAVASGKRDPQYTAFPFSGSAATFENNMMGRCKDIPQEIRALFRMFQPYKGGNDVLWALNEIAIGHKHTILTPVGTCVIRPGTSIEGFGYFCIPDPPIWDRSKNEIVYLTLGPDSQFTYQFDFTLFVAFDEIEIIGGQPALGILNTMAGEVESILMVIEAESRRIGLIDQG